MSYAQLGAKIVGTDPWSQAAAGLGAVYTIGTSVPLLGNVKADIPVEQITGDAIDAAKGMAVDWFKRNWMIVGGAAVIVVGGAMLLRRTT